MIKINYNSAFPDQVVPEEEKKSREYGLQVAQAIEHEWFRNSSGQNARAALPPHAALAQVSVDGAVRVHVHHLVVV